MSLNLDISDFLLSVSDGVVLAKDIARLEDYIEQCNESLRVSEETGADIAVDDSIYEALVDLLKQAKPDSPVLKSMWSDTAVPENLSVEDEVDYLKFRRQFPMLSINTIKELTDDKLREFIDALPFSDDEPFDLLYSMKLNGHGVEVVLEYGEVYWGGSRARSAVNIKNLTRQFKITLSSLRDKLKEKLGSVPLCSIRGEYVLPFANFEKARGFNPEIKTAFTGVSSMIKASASDEEIGLLEFVAYGFYADGIEFTTQEDMYNFLEDLGFTTPLGYVQRDVTKSTLIECMDDMLKSMEEDDKDYEYFTDGVVCSLNDRELLFDLGTNADDKYLLGNVALKVGDVWAQNNYSGIVWGYDWTFGKGKLSPVAIVVNKDFDDFDEDFNPMDRENKVLTATGNGVSRVPLYEPANILQLEAYPHSTLFFKYGGESGVLPCFPNGVPLEKNYVAKLIKDMQY